MNLLHLYAQEREHGEAYIVGNRESLEYIVAAIELALNEGHAEINLVAADGEGYTLKIIMNNAEWQNDKWLRLTNHYNDSINLLDDDRDKDTIHPEELIKESK